MLKVSCILATYWRTNKDLDLLDEAVESFFRQDYPNKELIIVNDTPNFRVLPPMDPVKAQMITVANSPKRFKYVGDKIDWAIQGFATGDVACRWDDDDISLPWRLSYCMRQLGDNLVYTPSNYWYCPHTGPEEVDGAANIHIQGVFRLKALAECFGGRYPRGDYSGAEDQAFLSGAKDVTKVERIPTKDMFYLYRWGVSSTHLSGKGTGPVLDQHYKEISDAAERRSWITGNNVMSCTVTPNWKRNYEEWVKGYVAA